jgi:hypothetical protein
MSMLGRLLAGFSVMALVLLAAGVACPEGLAALGLDFADFREQLDSLANGKQRSRELDEQMNRISARRAISEQITRALIAERLSLAEAATRFRKLPDFDQAFWKALRRLEKGSSDDECLARHLIGWVRVVLQSEGRADEAAAISARLEKELQDSLGRDGFGKAPRGENALSRGD